MYFQYCLLSLAPLYSLSKMSLEKSMIDSIILTLAYRNSHLRDLIGKRFRFRDAKDLIDKFRRPQHHYCFPLTLNTPSLNHPFIINLIARESFNKPYKYSNVGHIQNNEYVPYLNIPLLLILVCNSQLAR